MAGQQQIANSNGAGFRTGAFGAYSSNRPVDAIMTSNASAQMSPQDTPAFQTRSQASFGVAMDSPVQTAPLATEAGVNTEPPRVQPHQQQQIEVQQAPEMVAMNVPRT